MAPFGFDDLVEQLWLRPLNEDEYQVCCLPFRVYGLALGDVVELDEARTFVTRVVRRSGSRVLRLFFPIHLPDEVFHPGRAAVASALEAAGLSAEWSGDRHVAVHVPPEGLTSVLWDTVHRLGEAVRWEWADVADF
ncbi:hypothetical protein JOF53_007472 [Crossiella equi]|uniref:DUF4265 domain-containing protein n=1 Tax=Crossiella equi TaxID=130796 RepID=A0ABS5ASD3_9PSEU|nr:DUF4265 domain-containing protein [Crossiella equi]MBP2478600.1 hypothetical protein [Crossiella equi]